MCTSANFLKHSASGLLPTESLEHLIVLEPQAALNVEKQLRSVVSSVASKVSICVFCDAWSPVVEKRILEHCKSPVLVSNPLATSATAPSSAPIRPRTPQDLAGKFKAAAVADVPHGVDRVPHWHDHEGALIQLGSWITCRIRERDRTVRAVSRPPSSREFCVGA